MSWQLPLEKVEFNLDVYKQCTELVLFCVSVLDYGTWSFSFEFERNNLFTC